MTVVASIPAAGRPRGADRRARLAAIAFAVAVHVLAILAVVLTSVSLAPPSLPTPTALELRPPPPPPPQPVAPKRQAGGSPASAPRHAAASSPRPQPAGLPPVRIRPPAPVPILPVPTPTLAAPKGPDLGSPVTGVGVSVGTGGQGVGQGNGPGGPGGTGDDPIWVDNPTPAEISDAYPRAALKAGIMSGSMLLRCRIRKDGRVDRCAIISETPSGLGFGLSALKLSHAFRFRPSVVDGQPQDTVQLIDYGISLFDKDRLRDDE